MISAPTVVMIKNGEIVYFDNEILYLTGDIKPEEYFTDYRKNLIRMNFDKAILAMLGEEE